MDTSQIEVSHCASSLLSEASFLRDLFSILCIPLLLSICQTFPPPPASFYRDVFTVVGALYPVIDRDPGPGVVPEILVPRDPGPMKTLPGPGLNFFNFFVNKVI